MSDTIKCRCQNCGAKYRLPVESQGRKARCKKCGEVFAVPRVKPATVEDSILGWLDEPDSDDDTVARPRVINMPKDTGDSATLQSVLIASDLELVRVLEDLIAVLIDKRIIMLTDLPQAAQRKLARRYELRSRLNDLGGIVAEQEEIMLP